MNDRFKFRYVDKNNKVYDVMHLNFFFEELEVDMYDHIDTYKLEPDNLLQCTGLKDKNGTLIYEGDIVKTLFFGGEYQFNAKVVWNNDVLCFEVITFDNIKKALGACEEIKVIGNIYENPELLQGTDKTEEKEK